MREFFSSNLCSPQVDWTAYGRLDLSVLRRRNSSNCVRWTRVSYYVEYYACSNLRLDFSVDDKLQAKQMQTRAVSRVERNAFFPLIVSMTVRDEGRTGRFIDSEGIGRLGLSSDVRGRELTAANVGVLDINIERKEDPNYRGVAGSLNRLRKLD